MKILRHPDELARGVIGLPVEDIKDGVLFVLPRIDHWPIVMDAVMIPLDVYWLSESGMVVEHAELFPGQPLYWPDAAAQYVLELPMDQTPRYTIGQFLEVPP